MLRLPVALLLLASLTILAPGCASDNCGICDRHPPLMPAFELTGRGRITPDLSAAPELASFDHSRFEEVTGDYLTVGDADCQCIAATNSPVANLVAIERDMVDCSDPGHSSDQSRADEIRRDLLSYREVEERNKAAAQALKAFYSLSEAESGRDSLVRSFAEVQTMLGNLAELNDRGLDVPLTSGTLQRQNLDLNDRREGLEASLVQLNARLRQMLGMDVNDPTPIWPEWSWSVAATPDVNVSIAQAMAHRADLGGMDYLIRNLNEDTLQSARSALQRIEMSLGLPLGGGGFLERCKACTNEDLELSARRLQLIRARNELEREIITSVRERTQTLQTRLRQVTVAAESRKSWKDELELLGQKQEIGAANTFERSEARLEFIKSERDLIHALVAWSIAEVKLREACGLLALECGFAPEICYDCVDCCE